MNFQGFYNSKLKDNYRETYTLEDIIDNLTSRGWNRVGFGAFASVFIKKDKDYIVKVYSNDKGYDRYLEFLENNQDNPHAPKIFKKLKFPSSTDNEVKMVVMERLEHVNPNDWRVKTAEILENIIGSINPYDTEEEILFILKYRVKDYDWFDSKREENKIKRRIDFFIESNLDLIRFLINYAKFLKKKNYLESTYFDLHDKNYMVRPSTGEIVITDPSVYNASYTR